MRYSYLRVSVKLLLRNCFAEIYILNHWLSRVFHYGGMGALPPSVKKWPNPPFRSQSNPSEPSSPNFYSFLVRFFIPIFTWNGKKPKINLPWNLPWEHFQMKQFHFEYLIFKCLTFAWTDFNLEWANINSLSASIALI